MTKQEKVLEIIKRLKKVYPDAKIALNFENPFQLLIATILAGEHGRFWNQIVPSLLNVYGKLTKLDLDKFIHV